MIWDALCWRVRTLGRDTMQQRELDAFKVQMEREILEELIQLLQHMNKFLADLPESILTQLARAFSIEDFPLGHVSNLILEYPMGFCNAMWMWLKDMISGWCPKRIREDLENLAEWNMKLFPSKSSQIWNFQCGKDDISLCLKFGREDNSAVQWESHKKLFMRFKELNLFTPDGRFICLSKEDYY